MSCKIERNVRQTLSADFLSLFCEKNSDGTRKLRLKGNDLVQRIGRRLTAADVPPVVDYARSVETIVNLDLAYNDLGDEGVRTLVERFLGEENDLEDLNLMHCDLTGRSVRYLNEAKYNKIKNLRLNGNKLCPQTAGLITHLLRTAECLEHLDIGETDQTTDSLATILHFVEYSRLKVLDVSRPVPKSPLYVTNSRSLANDVGYLLDVNTSLVEIHLGKCDLLGHDVELLLYGLTTNRTLILLDLSCNRIGNYGVELLAFWLKSGPTLRALNVSHNQVGEIGARALSLTLPYSNIRLLDVSHNKITEPGINHLLYTLKKPVKMRMFFLWGNHFGNICNQIINRLLVTKVLEPEYTDVQPYAVDGVWCAAYRPSNHYRHRYYCVMDHGCPVELKIRKNRLATESSRPRCFLDLKHYGRCPPVNFAEPPRIQRTEDDYCDSKCLDALTEGAK